MMQADLFRDQKNIKELQEFRDKITEDLEKEFASVYETFDSHYE